MERSYNKYIVVGGSLTVKSGYGNGLSEEEEEAVASEMIEVMTDGLMALRKVITEKFGPQFNDKLTVEITSC